MIRNPQTKQPKLTEKEKEVISCMAQGLSTKQIAEKLFNSTKTISNHRENMLEKFGLENSVQLVDKWRRGEV